jgi:hypothetical protein
VIDGFNFCALQRRIMAVHFPPALGTIKDVLDPLREEPADLANEETEVVAALA